MDVPPPLPAEPAVQRDMPAAYRVAAALAFAGLVVSIVLVVKYGQHTAASGCSNYLHQDAERAAVNALFVCIGLLAAILVAGACLPKIKGRQVGKIVAFVLLQAVLLWIVASAWFVTSFNMFWCF